MAPPRGNAWLADLFGIPVAPKGKLDMLDYRPNALSQPPRFRDALKSGEIMFSNGIGIPSIEVAKICAQLNFDACFIDAEHTPMGPDLLANMVRTVHFYSEGSTAAIVRLPVHGHEWIAWALDAGAAGVILPHTESAEQAKYAVDFAKFGPQGHRSFPPFAFLPGHNDGVPDGSNIFQVLNDNAAVIMQIESLKGVENAEAIAAVPGVDAIMIGRGDLRFDMGLMGADGVEPEYLEAVKKIEAAARRNNLPLMGFAMSTEKVMQSIKDGWRLFIVAADALAIVSGQTGILKGMREAVAETSEPKEEKASQ